MKTLKYEIEINAPSNVVWNTLTNTEKYEQWVKAFSPNSYMEGEWIQGAYVKFLDPDMGGTKAVIEILQPGRHILARHVSVISKEGEESTKGGMAGNWVGTTEEYCLTEKNKATLLVIEVNTHPDFIQMFESAWPQAISGIKELSEADAV